MSWEGRVKLHFYSHCQAVVQFHCLFRYLLSGWERTAKSVPIHNALNLLEYLNNCLSKPCSTATHVHESGERAKIPGWSGWIKRCFSLTQGFAEPIKGNRAMLGWEASLRLSEPGHIQHDACHTNTDIMRLPASQTMRPHDSRSGMWQAPPDSDKGVRERREKGIGETEKQRRQEMRETEIGLKEKWQRNRRGICRVGGLPHPRGRLGRWCNTKIKSVQGVQVLRV